MMRGRPRPELSTHLFLWLCPVPRSRSGIELFKGMIFGIHVNRHGSDRNYSVHISSDHPEAHPPSSIIPRDFGPCPDLTIQASPRIRPSAKRSDHKDSQRVFAVPVKAISLEPYQQRLSTSGIHCCNCCVAVSIRKPNF